MLPMYQRALNREQNGFILPLRFGAEIFRDKGKDKVKMSETEKTIALKRQIEELLAENKRLKEENFCDIKQTIKELHGALKSRYVRLDELVNNPGLKHVAWYIFKKLDPKSLGHCRLVSKSWKDCIEETRFWCQKPLKFCRRMLPDFDFGDFYGERRQYFYEAFDYIYEKNPVEDLRVFALFMMDYVVHFKYAFHGHCRIGPVEYAIERNRLDVSEILLRSPMKNTMLHVACRADNVQAVQLILNCADELQIDLNARDVFDLTPLLYARDKNVLQLLLNDDRIDARAADEEGDILHRLCVYRAPRSSERSDQEFVDSLAMLLQSPKIQFTLNWHQGSTPLHMAFQLWGNQARAELLLKFTSERNLDVNEGDVYGDTAAHIAFSNGFGHPENMQSILLVELCPDIDLILKYAKKANINLEAVNDYGKTPLHLLCESSSSFLYIGVFLSLAKEEYGIEFNLEATDNNGKTPIELCRE